MNNKITFNNIINKLNNFWHKNLCIILQPIDTEVGAATFHPITFINAINSKKINAAYTQISKRPSDLRHTSISNRSILFHQYQVIMKPSPKNIQELYIESLRTIGIKKNNDLKFIEDNWQSPTLGANGIGWEVRLNGTEITQFTYFQQMGDKECSPIMVEIAYGLERIAMHIQKKKKINDIIYEKINNKIIKYSDIYSNYEKDFSKYISEDIEKSKLIKEFNEIENECIKLINKNNICIAYEKIIKLSNIFNLIECKNTLDLKKRYDYISKIRSLAKNVAEKIKNEKNI